MRKGVGLRQHGDSGLGQHLIADERCIADHSANTVFLFAGKYTISSIYLFTWNRSSTDALHAGTAKNGVRCRRKPLFLFIEITCKTWLMHLGCVASLKKAKRGTAAQRKRKMRFPAKRQAAWFETQSVPNGKCSMGHRRAGQAPSQKKRRPTAPAALYLVAASRYVNGTRN